MKSLLLAAVLPIVALAAPVPFPKWASPYAEFKVGQRFRCWNYEMRIYAVSTDGFVFFESAATGYRDWSDGDSMTLNKLRRLLRECPQRED